MERRRVVVDSNVLVSGLRSRRGTAFRLLSLVGTGAFTTVVSVPLVAEYEKALRDRKHGLRYSAEQIGGFLDYVCAASDRRKVHFLWRPHFGTHAMRWFSKQPLPEGAIMSSPSTFATF